MMSRVEREFNEYESQHIWPHVYQKIKNEASLQSISEKHSVGEARKPENRLKNRYRDVSPYDHSRVVLNDGDSDYINASFIQVPQSNRRYILSQGPLEHTAGEFWQMIWEQNTKAVIMLNRVIEKGTLKCHQYWPLGEDEDDEEMMYEETGLKITLQEEQEMPDYTLRTFDVENLQTNEVREVYHFHYTTWPDFGIPSSPNAFLEFLYAVREKGVLSNNVGPSVIHCSAGIGRSGTFCLVDSALVLVEKTGTMEGIDVQSLLISMRSYRMGLIQTFDQLKFSYMAIIAGGKEILKSAGAQQVNSVLDDYINREGEDEAPTPPQRVESLSPSHRGSPPPPPPRSFPVDDHPEGSPSKQRKLDEAQTAIPPKPPRAHVFQTNDDDYVKDYEAKEIVGDNVNDTETDKGVKGERLDTENNNPVDEAVNFREEDRRDEGPEGGPGDQEGEGIQENSMEEAQEQQGNDVSEQESGTQLRQRRKEEREKRKEKTQEMLRRMKAKQHQSDTWKKRKSYFKPIAIGLSIIFGSYLLYKFLW
ncbi:tyrosine-protein phosphatase non-receptor type 1-like isoform X1 [Mya arenaria]|uniref:tyrosine-protein phosphatase non-receptor type 1-like isoform X1 n=1 Tax=Mya arenaria TaxID=6604 RepID=UPI0022E12C71|nr:tyrosine-protein phosphatase non-receptor type 1-like isoform X1 [Mya arenaria]